jgi:hypothetical protein
MHDEDRQRRGRRPKRNKSSWWEPWAGNSGKHSEFRKYNEPWAGSSGKHSEFRNIMNMGREFRWTFRVQKYNEPWAESSGKHAFRVQKI